jgi:hypothetical protein
MRPFYAIACAVMGVLIGLLMPIARPGPSQAETVLGFAVLGLFIGVVLDVLRAGIIEMMRDHQHNADDNVNAHRIVAESTADNSEKAPGLVPIDPASR